MNVVKWGRILFFMGRLGKGLDIYFVFRDSLSVVYNEKKRGWWWKAAVFQFLQLFRTRGRGKLEGQISFSDCNLSPKIFYNLFRFIFGLPFAV